MLLPNDKLVSEILGGKGESRLHRLDPRVKIIWFGLMFATGFIVLGNLIALVLLALYVLFLGGFAGVLRRQLAMMRIVLPLFVMVVFFGAVIRLETVWLFTDVMNAFMALPNLVALVFLGREIRKIHKDYFTKRDFSISRTVQ